MLSKDLKEVIPPREAFLFIEKHIIFRGLPSPTHKTINGL